MGVQDADEILELQGRAASALRFCNDLEAQSMM